MKRIILPALLAFSVLAGCGASPSLTTGGGTPPPAPVADPYPTFTGLLNNARVSGGQSPLTISAPLMGAAQGHADDMSDNSYFSHTGLDGSTIGVRVAREGYDYCWAGENIAAGHSSTTAVFNAWMASPGHNANMMSNQPTEFGLGYAPTGSYRVLVLARPGC